MQNGNDYDFDDIEDLDDIIGTNNKQPPKNNNHYNKPPPK